jgi:hypothetical protein
MAEKNHASPITRRHMLTQTAKGAALASVVPFSHTQPLLAEAGASPTAKPATYPTPRP